MSWLFFLFIHFLPFGLNGLSEAAAAIAVFHVDEIWIAAKF